jgi:hypothetical protein
MTHQLFYLHNVNAGIGGPSTESMPYQSLQHMRESRLGVNSDDAERR